jgi:ParB family transcriptional regulator, chromosome partitioning protein
MTDTNSSSPPSQLPKRRGLGRGLDALFEDTELTAAKAAGGAGAAASTTATRGASGIGKVMMNITKLKPGQFQPRRTFNDDSIHQLAQSIAQHGIIQPLLVRPLAGEPGMFEIIAGERRWRAAQKAQLHDVPVVINDQLNDRDALQIALIENIQREDLNAIDEAMGYQRLMDEFHFVPERLGEMIGKSRSHIVNMTRLLQLPPDIRDHVVAGRLSVGHARPLIGLATSSAIADEVIAKKLSVRQTEKLAEEHKNLIALGKQGAKEEGLRRNTGRKGNAPKKDMHVVQLEKDLMESLGLRVDVMTSMDAKGRVTIEFKSLDQLDLIARRLLKA